MTIFTADIVVTDWSGIAFEFAYATKKPCLFINTPNKVMNPEYDRIPCIPVEVSLRDRLGISLEEDMAGTADKAIQQLLDHPEEYRQSIEKAMEDSLFHPGHSAEVAGRYIIEAVDKKEKQHKEI